MRLSSRITCPDGSSQWAAGLGRLAALALGLLLLIGGPCAAQGQPFQEREGYQLWPTQVVVNGPAQWRAWESADGLRVVEADGLVRPRLLRRDINAALNAADFTNIAGKDTTFGGISAVGVRADTLDAPFVMDGDPTTWWEPDAELPEDAWVELDLGRTVIARRIRLVFAPEGMGDPFLKFRVLVSDGSKSFSGRRRFLRVGQVATPNKSQRSFTFDIEPFRPVPEGIVGEPVQYVRIDMLATAGPRAAEISQEQHFRLGPDDRGAVDHFRRTTTGREIRVVEETYRLLPEAERGPVRYYRREHPRLAEVEVEAVGDNIVTLTQRPLLRESSFFEDLARRFVTDGLQQTGFTIRVYDPFRDRQQIEVDLGGKFWLDRLRLISSDHPMTSYQLRVSDGSLEATGEKAWHAFEERVNAEQFLQVEERFPARPVRFIELRRLDLLGDIGLSGLLNEIQAYGEGYVADATLTSPLIKLPGRRMVTHVQWEGTAPPGTEVVMRTRSGDELIQIPHYYNRTGREVSEALYERLIERDKGPVYIEEIPGPDWSTWSEPYAPTSPFLSPSPRRMMMIRVGLRSLDPLRHAAIRTLVLKLGPPLVDRAVAEVTPYRDVPPGQERDFHLYLAPLPEPGDPGFERLRVRSASSAPLTLIGLRQGQDADLRFGAATQLWPGLAQVRELPEGGVEVILPEGPHPVDEILEFSLRTSVFVPSTEFTVELVRGDQVQMADAGDANSLIPSSSLVVMSDLGGVPLLAPLRVEPPVFTPNNDGVNDQTSIQIAVYHVEGQRRLRVGIHDLSGRLRRDLSIEPQVPSGTHRIAWDGRDGAEELLPPGTYIVRVHLPTDSGASHTTAVRLVHLAY